MNRFLYPEQQLRRRALSWALRLKVNPTDVRIEDLKDRWGCCTRSGEVILALDLTQMDDRFCDYVIVHELLHLRLRRHNKTFKTWLTAYVPDWRTLDAEVRERDRSLE